MRFRKSNSTTFAVDMTPMIDMTFQLITFFMVVINFEQTQADERVKLPTDQLAVPPDAPRINDIVLNIGFERDAQGNILGEPGVYYGEQRIPVLDYGPNLKVARDQHVARFGQEALSEVTIVIRADAEVPTGLVQELMRLAQEVGFSRFTFKAKQSALDSR
jgi:biopolymer transport protein ExbD